MPALGFGTWLMTGADCVAAVHRALEIGYRHIDTAASYGTEAEVGQAIRESGVPREDIFLTTKVARNDLAHEDLLRSFDESLRQLAVEYVDLLLIHWPNTEIPLSDSLPAMEKIRAASQAPGIGVSNFPIALLKESVELHKATLLCDQVKYHPCPSSKQMGPLRVFHRGGSGSSLFDVKPLGVDGSSGGFGWSVFLIFLLFSMMAVWRPK